MIELDAEVLVNQQRQQKGARKLRVRQPGLVKRIATLEREQVNEDRVGAAEENVVRRRVLEAETFGEQPLGNIESQFGRGVEHFRGPLIRERGERDPLMFYEGMRPKVCQGGAHFGPRRKFLGCVSIENLSAHELASCNEVLDLFRREEGLEFDRSRRLNDSDDAAVNEEQPTGRITERSDHKELIGNCRDSVGRASAVNKNTCVTPPD